MKVRLFAVSCAAMLILGMLPSMVAAREPTGTDRPLPSSIEDLKLDKPETRNDLKGKIHKSLADSRGPQRVMVRLTRAPSAAVAAQGEAAQVAQLGRVRAQQRVVIAAARRLDSRSRVLASTARATNVVALRIDASKLDALAKDANVVSIKPVIDYQMALVRDGPVHRRPRRSRIAATRARASASPCSTAASTTRTPPWVERAQPRPTRRPTAPTTTDPRNTTLDGLFPTAKVKGGYDFVGESWPER